MSMAGLGGRAGRRRGGMCFQARSAENQAQKQLRCLEATTQPRKCVRNDSRIDWAITQS